MERAEVFQIMRKRGTPELSRRRGIAFAYTVVTMTVLMSFLGLAVDLARTQAAKTELHRLADAAARAAVAALPSGTTAAQNAAIAIAAENPVDGGYITLSTTTDIQVGYWNTSNDTFTSGGTPTNAVRVYARRTTANSNPIPLLFGKLIGVSTVDVWASSTAALVPITGDSDVSAVINATSNPWLANEPAGTTASETDAAYADSDHEWKLDMAGTYGTTDPTKNWSTDYATGQPYSSPLQVNFAVSPGDVLEVTNVTGEASKGPGDDEGSANGDDLTKGGTSSIDSDDAADGVSEHGISDINIPSDAMVGVFTSNTVPDDNTAPAKLDFSTQTERDYTSINPLLQQSFYVGTGTTSSSAGSTQQYITVPSGATKFFLGTMDGHEWSNNSGSFTATITAYQITTVQ
jgi:Flp pilus assembly protein TadG